MNHETKRYIFATEDRHSVVEFDDGDKVRRSNGWTGYVMGRATGLDGRQCLVCRKNPNGKGAYLMPVDEAEKVKPMTYLDLRTTVLGNVASVALDSTEKAVDSIMEAIDEYVKGL